MGDERVDETLRVLGSTGAVPPLSQQLERELADLAPVRPRSPMTQLAIFIVVSTAVAGLLLGALSIRRDLELLPRGWLIVYSGAWLASFLALGFLALVPARGAVTPRWRVVGLGALILGTLFIGAGLLFARAAPGVSLETPDDAGALFRYGHGCLRWGVITAVAPVVLGALFLRGAVPVGARWVAAGLGAAGGALGGLMLHLHCRIADPMHMGLVHGGVVVVGSLLAALAVSRLMRP